MFAIPTFEEFEERIGLDARQISLLLMSMSIILWSISMVFSKLIIGSYGLINGINPLFFVSISLLIISFFITIQKNIENRFILVLHLALIVIFTSSIPALIEGTPRFPYNYETSRSVDFILQYGYSNNDKITYQSWPGVFYFGAIETLITNISPINSLLVIPLFFIIINLLFSFLLYSTFLNQKETWIALLVSNVLFFASPIYLLPGVIGSIMISFALLMFFRFDLIQKRASFGSRTIFIIFCSAAVISHFLSSIYLFMTLLFVSILYVMFKGKMDNKFLLVFVLIVAFQIYIAGSYALVTLSSSVHDALDLEKTVNDVKEMGYSGSQAHSNVVNVRIVSTLLFLTLALIGFLYEFFYKKRLSIKNFSLLSWFGANASVATLTSYSGEIVSRTFSISNNIFNILIAKVADSNKLSLILLFVLVISLPISIVNAYGNEKIDYVSPTEISGVNFLFDHITNDSTTIESLQPRIFRMRYSSNLTWSQFDLENSLEKNKEIQFRTFYNKVFILIGNRDIEDYKFQSDNKNINDITKVATSEDYNKIYDNKGFSLYYMG